MSIQNNLKNTGIYQSLSTGNGEEEVRKQTTSVTLLLSAFGASLLMFGNGINYVWTSPVIWKLKSNDTNINPLGQPATTVQIAIIAGLLPLGALLSPIFLTKFCDTIGRKPTMIMLSTVMLLAEITLAFSTTIYMYFISRFVLGFCIGGALTSTSIFLSEISEDHNRGKIGCFMGLNAPLGCLYGYIIGPFCSVRNFTLLCVVPNILNIICFLIYIPETPFYLASRGNKKNTIVALRKLRDKSPTEIETEYQTILRNLEETSGRVEGTWSSLFAVKSIRTGLIIAITLMLLLPLSGVGIVLNFAGSLFNISGSPISGDTTGIIVGLVKLISSILASAIIERIGRRPLLMISTLGVCLSNLSLGLFFYLRDGKFNAIVYLQWLPVVSVIFLIITYSLGLGVIPMAMMSELFPSNVKSKTSSSCTTIIQVVVLILTTTFPIMCDLIGESWCLWFLSLCELFGFLFIYYFVPEIKGKSPIEVQALLLKRRKRTHC